MKRLFSIIILLTISMSVSGVSAQSHEGRYYGWGDRARYYPQPKLTGDISQLVVVHAEGDIALKAVYTFNKRGDVITTMAYNSAGKLIDNSKYTYDYEKGTIYEAHYHLGELTFDNHSTFESAAISDEELFGIFGEEDKTEYKYDSKGRVIEEKSDYCTTTYEYDARSNKSKITCIYSDGREEVNCYEYDARGNVVKMRRTPGMYKESSHTTFHITYRR